MKYVKQLRKGKLAGLQASAPPPPQSLSWDLQQGKEHKSLREKASTWRGKLPDSANSPPPSQKSLEDLEWEKTAQRAEGEKWVCGKESFWAHCQLDTPLDSHPSLLDGRSDPASSRLPWPDPRMQPLPRSVRSRVVSEKEMRGQVAVAASLLGTKELLHPPAELGTRRKQVN